MGRFLTRGCLEVIEAPLQKHNMSHAGRLASKGDQSLRLLQAITQFNIYPDSHYQQCDSSFQLMQIGFEPSKSPSRVLTRPSASRTV